MVIPLVEEGVQRARGLLDALARLDPQGLVGWRVVDDLAKGLR